MGLSRRCDDRQKNLIYRPNKSFAGYWLREDCSRAEKFGHSKIVRRVYTPTPGNRYDLHGRKQLPQLLQDFEPLLLRHDNVRDYKVGIRLHKHLYPLPSVARFDDDVTKLVKHQA